MGSGLAYPDGAVHYEGGFRCRRIQSRDVCFSVLCSALQCYFDVPFSNAFSLRGLISIHHMWWSILVSTTTALEPQPHSTT